MKRMICCAVTSLVACASDPRDEPPFATPDEEIVTEEGTIGYVWRSTPEGPRRLAYTVRDGRAIHEGDIDLGPVETLRQRSIGELGKRWPLGIVPWTFGTDFDSSDILCESNNVDCMPATEVIEDLFDELEVQLGIDFQYVPPASFDPEMNIVIVVWGAPSGAAGVSSVGRQDGPQGLGFAMGQSPSGLRRTAIHETMHMLGVWHEQSRGDRDSWVTYDSSCVLDDLLVNFDPQPTAKDIGPYDLFTTMHYQSTDGCVTWMGSCICLPLESNVPSVPSSSLGSEVELTAEDVNAIWQMYTRPLDGNEAADRFGAALASGDFDQDGYDDLAIGIPEQSVGGHAHAGAVIVYRGTSDGPVMWMRLTENAVPVQAAAANEAFGTALAAGDFDGDGIDDLAVGAPGEQSGAGAVFLFRGTRRTRLQPSLVFTQETYGIGASLPNERFGQSLAMGPLTGATSAQAHPFESLAVGAPFDQVPDAAGGSTLPAGAVYIYSMGRVAGTTAAVLARPTRVLRQGAAPTATDELGAAVAIGFIDTGDGRADLAIGGAGSSFVELFRGRLPPESATSYSSVVTYVATRNGVAGERFGQALAIGSFLQGRPTVAVGAPQHNVGTGRVVLYAGFGSTATVLLDGARGAAYGSALAIGDVQGTAANELLIGSPEYSAARGKIRVFVDASTTTFIDRTQSAVLSVLDTISGDRFGNAIALGNFNGAVRPTTGHTGDVDLDVAVGAVGEAPDRPDSVEPAAGAVYTLYGGGQTVSAWHQLDQEFPNVLTE